MNSASKLWGGVGVEGVGGERSETKTNILYEVKPGGKSGVSTSDNITKKCLPDGTWNNKTDYDSCLDHLCCHCVPQHQRDVPDWQISMWILGYSVSIISLLFAIFIFMYFRWEANEKEKSKPAKNVLWIFLASPHQSSA